MENANNIGIDNDIKLQIINVFNENITITEAKRYDVKLKENLFLGDIYSKLSGMIKLGNIDFVINDLSARSDKISKKYLQQNSLFLTQDTFLSTNLTVKEQLRIVSLFYCGFDLSDAAISSFSLKELREKKIEFLTKTEQKMVILSYVVACPSIIWFIDNDLLNDLNDEQKKIFNNAVSIRTKHGGVVIVVFHGN